MFINFYYYYLGLEKQRESVKELTDLIDATPEWQEYHMVSEEVVDQIHEQWANNGEPITNDSITALHRRVRVAVDEMQAFYGEKLRERVAGEVAAGIETPMSQLLAELDAYEEARRSLELKSGAALAPASDFDSERQRAFLVANGAADASSSSRKKAFAVAPERLVAAVGPNSTFGSKFADHRAAQTLAKQPQSSPQTNNNNNNNNANFIDAPMDTTFTDTNTAANNDDDDADSHSSFEAALKQIKQPLQSTIDENSTITNNSSPTDSNSSTIRTSGR
jgi:hypothetical protein